MPQSESLNINVTQKGSKEVARLLTAIAEEARKAASAVKTLRTQVSGKGGARGSAAEARGGGGAAAKAADKAAMARQKELIALARQHFKFREAAAKKASAIEQAADQAAKARQKELKALGASIYKYREAAAKKASAIERAADQAAKARQKELRALGASIYKYRANKAKSALKQEAAAHREAARAARAHAAAQRRVSKQSQKTELSLRSLGNQIYFAQRAFAALGGVLLVRGFLQMTDAFQNMHNRLKLVTTSAYHLGEVQKELFAIAKETRQSVADTVETYVRLNLSLKNSGISQKRLLGVMSTLNKMLAVSGASATEASQSIRQLSQAFSKGKLDGDEFRSVSEAMPSILTALEQSLGKTRGELRDMSEAGLLTGEVLINAFEEVSAKADQDFNNSIVTLGQSWQVLKDEVLKSVGAFNESSGTAGLLVDVIMLLANNLWAVVAALKVLFYWLMFKTAQALATASLNTLLWASTLTKQLIPSLVQSALNIGRMIGQVGLLKTISLGAAGPMGLLAAAVLAVSYAGYKLIKWLRNLKEESKFEKAMRKNANATKELEDRLRHLKFVDPTDARIAGLEKELKLLKEKDALLRKDEVVDKSVREEAARDAALQKELDTALLKIKALQSELATGASPSVGGGASIAGIVSQVSFKSAEEILNEIDLQREKITLLNDEADAIQAVRDAAAAEQQKEVDLNNLKNAYKDLRKELGLIGKDMSEYQAKVKTVKEMHERGLISIYAMTEALGRLEYAFQQTQESMRGDLLEAHQKKMQNLRVATAKYHALLKSGKSKEAAGKGAREELRLLEQRETLYKKLRGNSESNSEEAIKRDHDAADAFLKMARRAAAEKAIFDKLTDAPKKKKKEKLDTGDATRMQAMLDALRPTNVAVREFDAHVRTLDKTLGHGADTAKRKAEILAQLKETYKAAMSPLDALNKQIKEETELSFLSGREKEKRARKMQTEKELLQALGPAQFAANRAEIDSVIAKREANIERERTVEMINQVREALGLETQATKDRDEQFQKSIRLSPGADLSKVVSSTASLFPDQSEEINQLAEKYRALDITREGFENREKAIQIAMQAGILSTHQASAAMRELHKDMEASGTDMEGIRMGWSQLEEMFTRDAINQQIAGNMVNAFKGLEDQLVSLATTGEFSFKTMVDSMLADMTRLMIRMALMNALGLGAGGAGGAVGLAGLFRHGGTINSSELPRFANGGSMQVGGSGGPDTKLVQFMASPGENVHITNPGQSRMDNKQAAPQAPAVNITNVIDPEQFGAALASPAGQRSIINTIQSNPELFRRFLK